MKNDYRERLIVIGCGKPDLVLTQINHLVASSNQSFDTIFSSIEQLGIHKNKPLIDFDSLIQKEKPIQREPYKGYHNSKRKKLRK